MNLGRVGGQLLKQVVINQLVVENELGHSEHTRQYWRKIFKEHRIIQVTKDPSHQPYNVGRKRIVWKAKINGTIAGLKNELVKPEEVSSTLKTQLKDWLTLGLKDIQNRTARQAAQVLIPMSVAVIDYDPKGFCNSLKIFDFEFCETVEQEFFLLLSLTMVVMSMLASTPKGRQHLARHSKEIKKFFKYLKKANIFLAK